MSIKSDLLKKINQNVQRKKELAKEISREKTIAHHVSQFFAECEKNSAFGSLALNRLSVAIRGIDRKSYVVFKRPVDSEAQVEIHWSAEYIEAHGCEPVMVLDASSAFFESAMEGV